jgi:hypothetical protein
MDRLIASVAAVAVLLAGAFAVSLVGNDPAIAQVPDPETATMVERPDREAVLDEVLGGLVTDRTITQAQADAVKAALQAKGEELTAQREAFRAEREADRAQIREFLDDGVIDAGELAQLGDDHPLADPDGPFADALADGELTQEELREARGGFRGHGRGFHRGVPEAEGTDA